jgi:hypothetical protein
VLSLDEVEAALLEACNGNGLIKEDGLQACKASLASGLRKAEGDDLPILEDRPPPGGNTQKKSGERGTQAQTLIEIATRDHIELYHAPDGTLYADVPRDGHRETYAIGSPSWRWWWHREFYLETGSAPSRDALAAAQPIIEARAKFDGEEHQVDLRIAEHDGNIYVDLGDPTWKAVRITSTGWDVVTSSPVRFERTPGMLPLPEPVRGGTVDELRSLLPLKDATSWRLALSWTMTALRGRPGYAGGYPILALTGEHGTGKSTTARRLRSLIDPHAVPIRGRPREVRDLIVAARRNRVLIYDNLRSIAPELADALCIIATGGGFGDRTLYTNADESTFDGARPIGLTSIGDILVYPDLADRALPVTLVPISDDARLTDDEVDRAFVEARPRILGALYDLAVHGLGRLHIRPNRLPRMADHTRWAMQWETAIWTPGTYMLTFDTTRMAAARIVLESDLVAISLQQHLEHRSDPIRTTTKDLLATLAALVTDQQRRSHKWPQSPKALGNRLRELAPSLRKVGITIEWPEEQDAITRRQVILIKPPPPSPGAC